MRSRADEMGGTDFKVKDESEISSVEGMREKILPLSAAQLKTTDSLSKNHDGLQGSKFSQNGKLHIRRAY